MIRTPRIPPKLAVSCIDLGLRSFVRGAALGVICLHAGEHHFSSSRLGRSQCGGCLASLLLWCVIGVGPGGGEGEASICNVARVK